MLKLGNVAHSHVELFAFNIKEQVLWYFRANNVIGAKSLNAPILNVMMFLPFVVVP